MTFGREDTSQPADKRISTLRFNKVKKQTKSHANHTLIFYEYFIDGRSLPQVLTDYGFPNLVDANDFVGLFVEGKSQTIIDENIALFKAEMDAAEASIRFGVESHIFDYLNKGIIPYYTCSCGDFGCSGLELTIHREEKLIRWELDPNDDIPSIYFDVTAYDHALGQLHEELSERAG